MKQKVLCKATAMCGSGGYATAQQSSSVRNFLLSMKLTGVILLAATLQVSASTYAQKVTIHRQNSDLKTILNEIRKQTGYYFIFDKDVLQHTGPVTIQATDQELSAVLGEICSKQRLSYEIRDQLIIITPQPAPAQQPDRLPPPVNISGRVTDAKGQPLIGATVRIKDAQKGAQADANGHFSIQGVDEHAVLIVSYSGYVTQEIPLAGQTEFTIVLKEDIKMLKDMVVVVGYGTQKKVSLTSAVSVIQAEDISRRPVNNSVQAFQGLTPGLTIQDQGGAPGRANVTARIRGITTLSGNNPLVLVDGIEQGINNINPDDIESVSVLKDAAATSIYGSRAATGVILVTTKRAKEGQLNVSYNGYAALQQLGNHPTAMSTEDYMRQQNVAYVNAGQAAPYTEDYIKTYVNSPDRIKYPLANDFYNVLYRAAPQFNNNFSVSGGSKQFKALATVRYMKQDGITDNFSNDAREIRLNTDFTPSDKFRFSADGNYRMLYTTAPQDAYNVFYNTLHGAQFVTPRYPDGGYGLSAQGNNPLVNRDLSGYNNDWFNTFSANLRGEWNILKGLKFSTQYAIVSAAERVKTFRDTYAVVDENNPSRTKTVATNQLNENRNNNFQETINSLLEYKQQWGKHNFGILGGYSQIYTRGDTLTGFRNTFYSNDIQALSAGAASSRDNTGRDLESGLRSYFGRLNYNFDDKYLLEINGRYDGSSNFTGDNLYSFFPSFSAGWRISREKFWQPLANIIPEFKLRGSYGNTGNQTVNAYSFYEALNTLNYVFGGNAATGYSLQNYANRDIKWETTRQTDLGFDATVLNNKLDVVFDYYDKQTSGILLSLAIPGAVGLNPPVQNAGVVSNKGWELGLNYRDMSHKLHYAFNFNISNNINRIVDLKGTGPYITGSPNDGLYANKTGLPIGVLWGFKTDGLYKDADDVAKSAKYDTNTFPGDIKYVDLTGDHKITADDRTMIGDPFPHYTFGLTSNFQYGNFDLYLFLQGALKQDARISGAFADAGNNQGFVIDIEKDYWTPEHTDARFARPQKFTDKNAQISDFWVIHTGYIRVKSLQLGYTLPKSLTDRIKIKKARVYLAGANLFTISKANEWGIDPEFPTGRADYYPQTRVYTLGANVNF
ncbi:SusC/RagA family TonB-linked outer membrane protein [Chitinophaga agrisoli]|nr:TonB-dependent receptor [Chitinophaga agrisoli]